MSKSYVSSASSFSDPVAFLGVLFSLSQWRLLGILSLFHNLYADIRFYFPQSRQPLISIASITVKLLQRIRLVLIFFLINDFLFYMAMRILTHCEHPPQLVFPFI